MDDVINILHLLRYPTMGGFFFKLIQKGGTDALKTKTSESFFDLRAKDIYGKEVDFKTYSDRKLVMVTNVACK